MPDNQESLKPHLGLRRTDYELPKRLPPGFPKPRIQKDNVQYGPALSAVIKELQNDFQEVLSDTPPEFDPALIFRIKLEPSQQITEDKLRASGLMLIGEEAGNFILLFSPDQLTEFKRRIEIYSQEKGENRKNPPYAWIADLTNEMHLWGPTDRKGKKLSKIEIVGNQEYALDVELWQYGLLEDQAKRIDELKLFLEHNGGAFLDSFINSFMNVSRVKISGDVLNRLLTVGIVERIDLPPQPDIRPGEWIKTRIDDFQNVGKPSEDSPGICIIDSGILSGHPLLSTSIGETSAIPVSLGSGVDQNGHGTRVAGIALYGDVAAEIDNLGFQPQLFLFGARVTNADDFFDDAKLIESQMQDAIKYYHDQYGCRIFNISLADPEQVYDGGKPSPWAQVLDTLVNKLDILIVVSAGNILLNPTRGIEAEEFQKNYPSYLLQPQSRILEPATAANVLTVGALAHSTSTFYATRYPNDPSIRAMADIDELSPFTRGGPGVNDSIKPDLCEYGGNLMFHRFGIKNDPYLGVISMNHNLQEGLFTTDIGTSFAAPKVAHLAGMILKRYPKMPANLIRALIANSAKPPIAIKSKFTDPNEILQVCGYGKPDLEKAIYSTDNRVTLMANDEIKLDSFHVYKIPIPDSFKFTDGKRSITVTLAFDPPVRRKRKDYLGIEMKYYLLRGLSTEQVITSYKKIISDDEQREDIKKNICPTDISITKRSNGTLQKATWNMSRNGPLANAGEDIHLVIIPRALPWLPKDEFEKQRYAVVVTLEHSGASLYNLIEQRVRPEQRVRIR